MRISAWLRQSFNGMGGVSRRSKRDVHRLSSRGELLELVKARDWHLIETNSHYVVLYDIGAMRVWC